MVTMSLLSVEMHSTLLAGWVSLEVSLLQVSQFLLTMILLWEPLLAHQVRFLLCDRLTHAGVAVSKQKAAQRASEKETPNITL
jgi:hypothetical protein